MPDMHQQAANPFEAYFEAAPECIFIVEEETHRLLSYNQKARETFSLEACCGQRCFEALMHRNSPCENCFLMKKNQAPVQYRVGWLAQDFSIQCRSIDWNGAKAIAVTAAIVTEETRNYAQMSQLINAIHGGVAAYRITDAGDELLFCSDGLPRLTGRTREEYARLFKDHTQADIDEKDRPILARAVAEAIEQDRMIDLNLRLLHKDGHPVFVNMQIRRMGDLDGFPVIHAVVHNVSAATQMYQKLLDMGKTIIQLSDYQTHELLFVNQAAAKFAGRAQQDYVGMKCYEYMMHRQTPCPFCDMRRLPKEGKREQIELNGHYFDVTALPVSWNGRAAFAEYVDDITDSYILQQHISAEKKTLAEIVQNIPSGFAVYRYQNGEIRAEAFNPALHEIVGVTQADLKELTIQKILNFIHLEDREKAAQQFRQLPQLKTADFTCRIRKGHTRHYAWINVSARPVLQADGSLLIYTSYINVNRQKQVEAELKENEQRNRIALDAANLAIWTYDVSGQVFYGVNSAARRFGFTERAAGAWQTMLAQGKIFTESQQEFIRVHREIDAGAPQATAIVQMSQEQGGRCFARIVYTAMRDENGENSLAIGAAEDITTLMQAQARFDEEVMYRQAMSGGMLCSFKLNLSRNSIVSAESSSEYIMGLQMCGSVDRLFERFYQDEANEQERKKYCSVFSREKLINDFFQGNGTVSLVHARKMPDGSHAYLSTTAQMMQKPETGDIICFIYSVDITQQRMTENIMHALFEHEYDLVYAIDGVKNTAVRYLANQGAELQYAAELTDYESEMSYYFENSAPKDEAPACIASIQLSNLLARLENNESFKFVYTHILPNGERRKKQLHFRYMFRSYRILLMVRTDVTDAVTRTEKINEELACALSQAQKANAVKRDFLSNISHEVRTPMNIIMGLTALARQEKDASPMMQDYLKKIDSNSRHLLSLINDVLDQSEIETDALRLHPSRYTVDQLEETVTAVAEAMCQPKNITFIKQGDPVRKPVLVDYLRLNQVLMNLLSNAVKFTQEGGEIHLIINSVELNDTLEAEIVVSDNGIGMSEEFQKHMFEPFVQEERGVTAPTQGTGLGLAIVKAVVDKMNGRLSVKSTLGQGTEFHLRLSLPLVKEEAENAPKNVPALLRNRCILVAEDHPINRMIVKRLLLTRDMRVIEARDGQECVNQFSASRIGEISAILMDVRMPQLDGLAATKTIRAMSREDAKTVPIIAMTANAFDADKEKSMQAGMNVHLSKPIEPDILFDTLEQLLH